MVVIEIYCPVCKEKLDKMENALELEGYRIDCDKCGLYAYVEDVFVNK